MHRPLYLPAKTSLCTDPSICLQRPLYAQTPLFACTDLSTCRPLYVPVQTSLCDVCSEPCMNSPLYVRCLHRPPLYVQSSLCEVCTDTERSVQTPTSLSMCQTNGRGCSRCVAGPVPPSPCHRRIPHGRCVAVALREDEAAATTRRSSRRGASK